MKFFASESKFHAFLCMYVSVKKFRQINYLFSNFFSKTIDFTRFLRKKYEREFLQFSLIHFWQKFRENNILLKKILKSWFDEIFFGETEFFYLSTKYARMVNIGSLYFFTKIPWNHFAFVLRTIFTKYFSNESTKLQSTFAEGFVGIL